MPTTTYFDIDTATGKQVQRRTVEVSGGASSASQVPNLNAQGVLDATLVNSTVTSAGTGSSGKLAALDSSGKLDPSVIPGSVGRDAITLTLSETVAPSSVVNIHNVTGNARARNADAATGRLAHGFTLTGGASGTDVLVYFEGSITGLTGRTPGARQFLGAAGALTETPPVVGVSGVTAGYILQVIGYATGTASVSYEGDEPVTLA